MSTPREEIIQLLNLYALAVDTQRWDLFDRVFTEYVDADFGPGVHWTSLAQFKADFAAFHAPFDATQHVMTNHLVTEDGDVAHALTYGSWRLIRHAVDGGSLWDGTGWYDDELVRTHLGWRIRKRVCRVVWFTGNPRVKDTLPGVVFEDRTDVLRQEAQAGRLGFLAAFDAAGER
jgi:3-phenylpropionate/cinnamic acid dioxygenase small subunit